MWAWIKRITFGPEASSKLNPAADDVGGGGAARVSVAWGGPLGGTQGQTPLGSKAAAFPTPARPVDPATAGSAGCRTPLPAAAAGGAAPSVSAPMSGASAVSSGFLISGGKVCVCVQASVRVRAWRKWSRCMHAALRMRLPACPA